MLFPTDELVLMLFPTDEQRQIQHSWQSAGSWITSTWSDDDDDDGEDEDMENREEEDNVDD